MVLTFTPEEHISMMLKLQRHIDQMDDVSTDDLLDAMKGVCLLYTSDAADE